MPATRGVAGRRETGINIGVLGHRVSNACNRVLEHIHIINLSSHGDYYKGAVILIQTLFSGLVLQDKRSGPGGLLGLHVCEVSFVSQGRGFGLGGKMPLLPTAGLNPALQNQDDPDPTPETLKPRRP